MPAIAYWDILTFHPSLCASTYQVVLEIFGKYLGHTILEFLLGSLHFI